MPFLSDNVLDNGIAYVVSHGSRLDICSQEPANYTEATSTYTLGNKTSLSAGSPQNGASSGRRTIIPAITDGAVTGTDDATHWAYSKTTSTTELLAAQALSAPQAVTSGNEFTLDAISITFPDPS